MSTVKFAMVMALVMTLNYYALEFEAVGLYKLIPFASLVFCALVSIGGVVNIELKNKSKKEK